MWIIISAVLFFGAGLCFYFAIKDGSEEYAWLANVGLVAILLCFFILGCCWLTKTSNNIFVYEYKQKYEISSSLTDKEKTNLNDILLKRKFWKEYSPLWSLCPDEVLELELMK